MLSGGQTITGFKPVALLKQLKRTGTISIFLFILKALVDSN
jgi:hypothetical protein